MEQGKFSKAMTAAFTGHRYIDARKRQRVKETLKRQIVEAYGQGFRNFMSGFALGFDMMAAETVVSLRETCPGIILTAAIPFSSFLIAYYDGRERGGTFYTVKKAREQGLPVANVF